jgi:hypothetical protein
VLRCCCVAHNCKARRQAVQSAACHACHASYM